MTNPVPSYPHSDIACTRRTERGEFWLHPTPEVRKVVLYLALHYAARHRLRLFVLIVLANHLHLVGHDEDGALADFLRDFHSKVTEVLNDLYGREGRLWEPFDVCRTRLEDSTTVFNNLIYAATNAVKHGLVPVSTMWPGLLFSPEDAGREITVEAPQYLLDNYDSFPPVIKYVVPVPAVYGKTPVAAVRRDFRDRRRARERRLRHRRGDKPFLGLAKAMAVEPSNAPTEAPPKGQNKLFAAATKEGTRWALERLIAFRRAYRKARKAFLAGDRGVVWPVGTYAMHTWHGCPRAGP